MTRRFLLVLALLLALGIGQAAAQRGAPRMLDAFEDISPWRATGSDGVQARVAQTAGREGRALRLDYDFGGGAGYAVARRPMPIVFPENYEISFLIRGEGAPNNLELKLSDESGENVWWRVQRGFTPSNEWRRIVIRKRHIEFAWGPISDRALRRSEGLEFVISAGSGGAGFVEIDDLTIRELPPTPAAFPPPRASASSSQGGFGSELAVDGDVGSEWRSDGGAEQRLTLDLGLVREFGGLSLRWAPSLHANRYDIALSADGADWRVVERVQDGDGGSDHLMLGEAEARYVRIDLHEGPGGHFGLAEVQIRDLAFGASANAFFQALAQENVRGAYPRGFHGEQSYWTLVGVDGGGPRSALMSEDGALELGRGGFSLEPFVRTNGRVFGWAGVEIEHGLIDGYLPAPQVTWRGDGWRLVVTAIAAGDPGAPFLLHRYELRNEGARQQDFSLVLAARPFQVNAPQQFLNTPGGFSPINAVAWTGAELSVNGASRVRPLAPPNRTEAIGFDAGAWGEPGRGAHSAASEEGFAGAAFVYDVRLRSGQSASFEFVSSLTDAPPPAEAASRAWFARQEREQLRRWRRWLHGLQIDAPPEGARLVDTLRSSIAYMLMSRDGPALAPGTRSYARSWIRDGAMISEGLLRAGLSAPVREYLDWYAPFQFESGKVPCCVDARGADPVPENDSHGELIHLAALLHRYTGDQEMLDRTWPQVDAAIRYMDSLRASESTPANQTPERRALYGLLPPSISHEGYSARPAYSYWDNFWGLRGYEDAVYLARARGDSAAADRIAQSALAFEADIMRSIEAAAARFGVGYIPGAADLGDFDATSTTIALAPGGLQERLPAELLAGTFDRYWRNFGQRAASEDWRDYTPYELRVVGAFVRLGQRERAAEALSFFFRDRRPQEWNHWAEVVGREARQPRFIGDMPHAWVASDYVRSALDMFAYEDAERLVLAAGLSDQWFLHGVRVSGLHTPFGQLSYSIRKRGEDYVVRVDGPARPPGGYIVALPEGAPLCVNGAPSDRNRVVLSAPGDRARARPCRAEGQTR
jgi:hypothetical protein